MITDTLIGCVIALLKKNISDLVNQTLLSSLHQQQELEDGDHTDCKKNHRCSLSGPRNETWPSSMCYGGCSHSGDLPAYSGTCLLLCLTVENNDQFTR